MINRNEEQYLNLLREILQSGRQGDDRTGTGTRSLFGRQLHFDLTDGKIPLITTKKTFWKAIVIELLWLLRGETNTKFLHDYKVKIWDEWADEKGDLGPIYGKQWRAWETSEVNYMDDTFDSVEHVSIDQIKNVIDRIKAKPNCRRLIVSAWNPADIEDMKLPPCHAFFQFDVFDGELSCQLYQRSADMFLGVPFNIASYALLTHVIAKECDLVAREFIHTFGNAHIYNNHIEQTETQLRRFPKACPTVEINLVKGGLFQFLDNCHKLPWDGDATEGNIELGISDIFMLRGYDPLPAIKGEVSV